MANITLQGNEFTTTGELPLVGTKAKDFSLVGANLAPMTLADFTGKKVVMNIFPSIDTGTCAASVRYFNEAVSKMENTKVLCISRDLPFAQARFCGAEGLKDVITLSDFKRGTFGLDYGLEIANGPLANLHSRSVIVLDENGIVTYTQQVSETVNEPNYDEVLAAL